MTADNAPAPSAPGPARPATDRALRVGVVGGGQLARMMAGPALELGIELSILAEDPSVCAASAASRVAFGAGQDLAALRAFAQGLDVLTFEHEHVPQDCLQALEAEGVNVQPPSAALLYAQNKLHMRRKMAELGLPNPEWAAVSTVADIVAFGERAGWPVVVKTPQGGYDGKGVAFLSSADDAERVAAWFEQFDELLAEEGVDFARELSALVARRPSGETRAWAVAHTVQTDGVCDEVVAPAPGLSEDTAKAALETARRIAESLGVTGVLAVELFETPGRGPGFVINELAMRPHNTGHWTMDGAVTGQFEQHVRAVADLPLGDTRALAETAVMKNVLGGAVQHTPSMLPAALQHAPTSKVHHYGKSVRQGRKIGHVNVLGPASELDESRRLARETAAILRDGSPETATAPETED